MEAAVTSVLTLHQATGVNVQTQSWAYRQTARHAQVSTKLYML